MVSCGKLLRASITNRCGGLVRQLSVELAGVEASDSKGSPGPETSSVKTPEKRNVLHCFSAGTPLTLIHVYARELTHARI